MFPENIKEKSFTPSSLFPAAETDRAGPVVRVVAGMGHIEEGMGKDMAWDIVFP